ncbi:MAG: hypothetical protein KJ072_03495 [Verrucomicrobia bacterium]|nr:hypothetical protein [Verrucomicrobiota bacterium]
MRPTAKYLASLWVTTVTLVGQPYVLELATSVYAVVPDALALSFGADGALYVGRDASGSGGGTGDAVKIHRVERGGVPVEEYGATAVTDPDAVAYDAEGRASGVAGAVLVAGHELNSVSGKIVLVRPDQTLSTLYGPTGFTFNPNVFEYDLEGRLLFSE